MRLIVKLTNILYLNTDFFKKSFNVGVAVILFIFSCPTSQTFLKGEMKKGEQRGLRVIAKVKNDPLTSVLTLAEKIESRLDRAFRIRKTSSPTLRC